MSANLNLLLRRVALSTAGAMAVAITSLLLTAAPAAAAATRPFISSFGAGILSSPNGVAVDNSTSVSSGDVYVTSDSPPEVVKFDAEGNELGQVDDTNLAACLGARDFAGPFAVAVNSSNGDVYVADPSTGVTAFSPSGVCLFQINPGAPYGVAVDPSLGTDGTLYVSSRSSGTIKSFNAATGAPVSSIGENLFLIVSIAVDPSGNIYAVNDGDKVVEFEPDGTCANSCTPISTSSPASVAVDPKSSHVFVAENEGSSNSQIAEYYAPGELTPLGTFGQGEVGHQIYGMAIGNGRLYTTDYSSGGIIDVFQVLPMAEASTKPASTVTRTTATLNGHVDPAEGGEITECYFEYGPTASYGSTAPCAEGATYTNPADVHADISSLTTETTYHYRLRATDPNGTNAGADLTVTPHDVLELTTEPATNVLRTSASLAGAFLGDNEDTHYYFEWGTTEAYGHKTPVEDVGSTSGHTPLSSNIEGLSPETTYHYRVVATNALGTSVAEDRHFITLPAVTLCAGSPAPAGRFSASLRGCFVGSGEDTHYYFEWGTSPSYGNKTEVEDAGSPTVGEGPRSMVADVSGLQLETTYYYRVVAENPVGTTVGKEQSVTTLDAVENIKTEAASGVSSTPATLNASATLNGFYTGNGEETEYWFEWGPTSEGLVNRTPREMSVATGPQNPDFPFEGVLNSATEYVYRFVAENPIGLSRGGEVTFKTPPTAPLITGQSVSNVRSEGVLLHAQLNPGGAETVDHFEYGTSECTAVPNPCTSVPSSNGDLGSGTAYLSVSAQLNGLKSGTTYYWRVVAENELEPTNGSVLSFNTYPFVNLENDPCPNAHVRQQTSAAQLLDCRAYELVSAADTGGYDVESDLAAGQRPFAGYPEAAGRVLYGVDDGGIPGTDHPTNKGVDPYVATRGENGWSTEYAGVPANNPFSAKPFSSVPSDASASLETFAFGGPEGCSPCFEGGYTGIPVHLANGALVQGMVPAEGYEPGPSAIPAGYIAQDLSANGEHFIFGSTSQFAAGGNDETGDVSIYDHNLKTGETHVVSSAPGGGPLPCLQGSGECSTVHHDSNGLAELAISKDGSHILLGQKVATDADGNVYWRLYMNVGDSEKTIDLTPGATEGVLFDGMTEDGSKVFFTTKDPLMTAAGQDTDTSADIYEAEVSGESATLTRISTGTEGTGNSDACEPVANVDGEHWNTVGSTEDCGVVAIGGGGGVAAGSGSIYFLSPEQLDGASNGTANQPNLYLAAPGSAPRFIATLSPDDPVVLDSVKEAEARHTADFQVTRGGEFAAFPTTEPLEEGYDNAGFVELYRYDSSTSGLDCVSCNPTGGEATSSASLAADGLSLTEAGQVFFNSGDALALSDSDGVEDVYEWEPQGTGNCNSESPGFSKLSDVCLGLISTGSSPSASSLLGVSADGVDAYFFTRDSLAPQDESNDLVKIYDARVEGGFPYTPPQPQCKASDECHGPGSATPEPPAIRSAAGSGGNEVSEAKTGCKPGMVKKHGHCVRKSHPRKHHKKSYKHHGKRAAHPKRGGGK